MKRMLVAYYGILFIILLWLIFSSPFFIQGKIPFPSSHLVNSFLPWSAYHELLGPVKNGAMPDVLNQIYPWKYFTVQSLKHGWLPLWNPYSFSGNPQLANYQSAVLSPFNLFYFIFPFITSWSILVLLQPLIAGVGMYFFISSFQKNKWGAVVASVTWMFCGFCVVWMTYTTLVMAIVWLPWSLFAIEKGIRKLQIRYLLLLCITIPLSFFSGHFQTSVYFFLYTLLYLLFCFLTTKNKKASLYALGAIGIGLLISLLQIIPTIGFYQQSIRSQIPTSGGIPFSYLPTIIAPDFFGNPVTKNDWFGYYGEYASFIGIIPLTLTFFSLLSKKTKLTFFFFIAGIISLLLALDSPLQKLIAQLSLPVISTSSPSRIIVLFSFSFSVLAGIGIERVEDLVLHKKKRILIACFISSLLILAIIWGILLLLHPMQLEKLVIAKHNFILPTILFIAMVLLVWLIVLFIPTKTKLLLIGIVFLVSFDSFHFAQKWMPFDDKKFVYPKLPVISAMQQDIGNGRAFGNFGAFIDTYFGVPSIEGYDPLFIKRYGEFIQSAKDGSFQNAQRSVVQIDRHAKYIDRVLDLLGVTMIFHPVLDTNTSWAYPVWKDPKRFQLLFTDGKMQLFKNTTALARATLFYRYEVIPNAKENLMRLYSDTFDFRNTLLLEEDPTLRIDTSNHTGIAEIIQYKPTEVKIKIHTDSPAILFLSDPYYPNWKATGNGKSIKIYRADYAFRAVVVPTGDSLIIFSYSYF